MVPVPATSSKFDLSHLNRSTTDKRLGVFFSRMGNKTSSGASAKSSLTQGRRSRFVERRLKKADEILIGQSEKPISGRIERRLALAASLREEKPDFQLVVTALMISIPLVVAWMVAGGGWNATTAGMVLGTVVFAGALFSYLDRGSGEAAAAILEYRADKEDEQ